MRKTIVAAMASLGLAACAGFGDPAAQVTTEILVQSTASWDGADFTYPQGQPEITVVRITIPAGVSLPLHCHPVPLAGVVTAGRLEVRKPGGETIVLQAGDGLIEVFNQWHQGSGLETTEILVVYAGAAGLPVTVLPGGDPDLAANCR
jgi:quercetin dioxygenase-like cupin family protein